MAWPWSDVEIGHPPDAHAAQFHGRAQIKPMNGFVKKHHEPLRLGEEIHAAE
jgi:hypothetical protein